MIESKNIDQKIFSYVSVIPSVAVGADWVREKGVVFQQVIVWDHAMIEAQLGAITSS